MYNEQYQQPGYQPQGSYPEEEQYEYQPYEKVPRQPRRNSGARQPSNSRGQRQLSNSRGSRTDVKVQRKRSPIKSNQYSRGESPTQHMSDKYNTYAPPQQQNQYAQQEPIYYPEESNQRPTLKDEDYYNVVDRQGVLSGHQTTDGYTNYAPADEAQPQYIQVPGYEERQDKILQNYPQVQSQLQPREPVYEELKPVKKNSKTAYRNAQKARIRSRSKGSFSENSFSSNPKSPRDQRRSPKHTRIASPKITPVYSEAAYRQPVEYVPRLNPAAVPMMKVKTQARRPSRANSRSDSKIKARDVHQMQEAINRDYEEKLQAVNREAQQKLERVQQEHQEVLLESQRKYHDSRLEQSSMYDDLQKNFDRAHEDSLAYEKKKRGYNQGSFSSSGIKGDYRENKYQAPVSRPAVDHQQFAQQPTPVSSQGRQNYRESRQSEMVRKRPDSRGSVGTIGMLNSSFNSAHDIALDDNMLNNSNLSEVLNQERDPTKLRSFFKEFSEAIRNNKRRDASGLQNINIHDILQELGLLTTQPAPVRNRLDQYGETPRGIIGAHSTDMIRAQKDKFNINSIHDLTEDEEIIGKRAVGDDTVKNLFKVLCGIMNMPLKQRGTNPIDDKVLNTYLDSINPDLLDDDIVLLNQLATIKSLANRKAFSVSDKQIGMIHIKFQNMFDQRQVTPAHERNGTKRMSPTKDLAKNLVDRRQSSRPRATQHRNNEIEEDTLAQMELEESGVYRNIGSVQKNEREVYQKPRKESWLWGEKDQVGGTDRSYPEPKRPAYGVDGTYKPRAQEYKPPYADFEPPSTGRDTDRSRGYTNIGKGSRHASPRRESPRRGSNQAGGGGAIVNNYYGVRTNTSFISDVSESEIQKQQYKPPPIQYSMRKRSKSRSKSPKKKTNEATMPSMDSLQSFLNKAPTKQNTAEEKYNNLQQKPGQYAAQPNSYNPSSPKTRGEQYMEESSKSLPKIHSTTAEQYLAQSLKTDPGRDNFDAKLNGLSADFQRQYEQLSTDRKDKPRKSTRFEDDSESMIRDRNDSRVSQGSKMSHGGYDLS